MMQLAAHDRCTGCGNCACVCKKGAVSMQAEVPTGFYYPQIDQKRCTDCGRCKRVCPILSAATLNVAFIPQGFAARALDTEIRQGSTSGGIFALFAREVLARGGIVCGAAWDRDFTLSHRAIESLDELGKLQRSKYLQSRVWAVYDEVKTALDAGREVLFSGTPCQVAALRSLTGRWRIPQANLDKLLLVEVLCRGVPAPAALHRYLHEKEREQGQSISAVDFKVKDLGWHSLGTKYTYADGSTQVESKDENFFLQSFVCGDFCVRECCFNCPYKQELRGADLTLGDYWGLADQDLDDNLGVSAVIVSTPRGADAWLAVRDQCYWQETAVSDIKKGNKLAFSALRDNTVRRHKFWEYLQVLPYREALRRAGE